MLPKRCRTGALWDEGGLAPRCWTRGAARGQHTRSARLVNETLHVTSGNRAPETGRSSDAPAQTRELLDRYEWAEVNGESIAPP